MEQKMKDRYIHAVSMTDASGVAIQHLEYMSFGEVFVDQRRTGFGTPYKFNAKELDCESGYYYYSARYYDPRMARFLSVDPLASDMPAWCSYTYTFDNPVRLVDPTGMRPEESDWEPKVDSKGISRMFPKMGIATEHLWSNMEKMLQDQFLRVTVRGVLIKVPSIQKVR